MAYRSSTGRRPDEKASKAMHSHIINDNAVKEFLAKCKLPEQVDDEEVASVEVDIKPSTESQIEHIISFDGGFTETSVREQFPSSNIAFFQFGVLCFEMADLIKTSYEPFISPEAVQKLKQIDRYKLPLPTKNIIYEDCATFRDSFRKVLHQFCAADRRPFSLNETLRWLMFEEYNKSNQKSDWNLASCPLCGTSNISLERAKITADNTFICPHCKGILYLIDAFRLHEIVDEEVGARGVLGFITVALEQILMIAVIRYIFEETPKTLSKILFVKDGPLAFYGQTANFQKPTRKFLNHIRGLGYPLYIVGAEKSGPFVEHALQIKDKMKPGSYIILSNDYIYRHILPTTKSVPAPYGSSTYYGNKIIFKNEFGDILIISMPTDSVKNDPQKSDFDGIDLVLTTLTTLRCDSFDSSLIPVAIVNKLVSLSNHPSSDILKKFAKSNITNE